MIQKSIARRYARALFEVIWSRGLYNRIYGELKDLSDLLDQQRMLKLYLQSPHVLFNQKQRVIRELGDRLQWHPITRELIGRVVKNRRLNLLPFILEELENRRLEVEGYVRVRVITAIPLNDKDKERIERELEEALGKKVVLEVGLNPEILGGLVIQLGSIHYDASLTARLKQLREKLAGEETHGYRH